MSLKNLTPLHCLPLDALTPTGDWEGIVIVKLTLDLVPGDPSLQSQGFTHLARLSEEQAPLLLCDTCHGEMTKSSVLWESDTASPKPRCDVVVIGMAHAPGGRSCGTFQAGLKVEAAWAKANPIPGTVLLDKRLQVSGERWLKRRNLLSRTLGWFVRRCPWKLSRPRPVAAVPLLYEYAYGGHVQVKASDPGSGRVCRPGLGEARKAWKEVREDAVLAEAWWARNPVGRAYAPLWFLKATDTWRLAAPQFEDPAQPFTARAAWKAMLGKADGKFGPPLMPQGLGVVTGTWEPRVRHAGTWDAAWAESGNPYPPDYSPAFGNFAPLDQQCRHLAGDEVMELTNLCAPGFPGVRRDPDGNQVLRFRLPGLHPFLLLVHEAGETVQVPAVLDTVVLEPDRGKVTLLQRCAYPIEPEPAELELRLAMPGEPREVPLMPEAGEADDEPEWEEADLVE